jgi:hypothetical protein
LVDTKQQKQSLQILWGFPIYCDQKPNLRPSVNYTTSSVNAANRKSGASGAASNHNHTTLGGNTDTANNLPPYRDMVFASKDSDGSGVADNILIVITDTRGSC